MIQILKNCVLEGRINNNLDEFIIIHILMEENDMLKHESYLLKCYH